MHPVDAARARLVVGLVSWVRPVMYGWFLIGAGIVILYHLSLYTFEGEFRLRQERALDLALSILRAIVFFVAWPAVFYFDRTAASRIWLFLRYLDPGRRAKDPDIIEALKERDYRIWQRSAYLTRTELEGRRARELRTRERQSRRQVALHEDSPALDRYWLLTGVGTHYGAVEELVRLYPDYHLPEEIEEGVRRELRIRHLRACPGCGTELRPGDVKIPGVVYLRVLAPGTERLVMEGWAVEGSFVLRFEPCGNCGHLPEPVEGRLADCGQTRAVIGRAKSGLVLHRDIP